MVDYSYVPRMQRYRENLLVEGGGARLNLPESHGSIP